MIGRGKKKKEKEERREQMLYIKNLVEILENSTCIYFMSLLITIFIFKVILENNFIGL